MKKPLLFVLSLMMVSASFAQITIRIGRHDAPATWKPSMQQNFASSSEAQHYAQEIINVVGLKPNFEVMASNSVDNAAAVTYGGKRYVLYNPRFIDALVQRTGNKWAAVSVLAHEIGHHLNGHTVSGQGSQPAIELEADEFSGFVLRKMGASLQDAQAAMKLIAAQTASRTHPAQYDRLAYIERGWRNGGGERMSDVAVSRPQPRVQQPTVRTQPVYRPQTRTTPDRNTASLIGTVRFNANPYAQYFVTSNYQLVQVQNQQVRTIGKVARLNSNQYPYMIYDEQHTQLLVDTRGAIVTRQGRQVGQMSAYNG